VTLWLDAQLSPSLAAWLSEAIGVLSVPVRDVGLRDATDRQIFQQARAAGVIVVTKDADFVRLLEEFGPPPQVVWLTCGNTSNVRLRELLIRVWPDVAGMLRCGEALVEIGESSALASADHSD
jgi:predicted nuclease of predicted toxin-antitoxin system